MTRLSPEEIHERAVALNMQGSLDAHGFDGGLVREGWAVRVLFRRGRRFEDHVMFARGEDDASGYSQAEGEVAVLSRAKFPILSDIGPVLVVDRIIPTRMEGPEAWVDAVTADVLIESWAKDMPPRPPMPQAHFWSLIDLLDGGVDDISITRLSEALTELPFREIQAFRDALWERLHELDHPENTVRMNGIIDHERSLSYRCEIVASGPGSFLERLRNPQRRTGRADVLSDALLRVAAEAAPHELAAPQVTIETGQNERYWSDARKPQLAPWETWPGPGPFSYEVQLSRLRIIPPLRRSLVSFLAYAVRGDEVRELMGCLMAGSVKIAEEEAEDFLRGRLREGEVLHPTLLVKRNGTGGVSLGVPLADVTRRSSLSMDDYIATYYLGKHLPARRRR
ncbi:DUF4240 domain-containing protein [Microbacterium tumbae]